MDIQSVWIRRDGGEDNPRADVVVLLQDGAGEWREIIRERVDGNFSHAAHLPGAWLSAKVDELAMSLNLNLDDSDMAGECSILPG